MTINVADVDPDGTETDIGTTALLLSLRRLSVAPPAGAAALRLTVQLEVAGPTREEEEQASALRLTA